jgi:hypothetical protein
MNDTETFRLDMTMMLAIHDALRRDLRHITRIADDPNDKPARRLQDAAGWHMFKTYLQVHHLCEDELLWPLMAPHLAGRPGDLALLADLQAEHTTIDPLLSRIDAAGTDDSGPESVAVLASDLTTALTTHLSHEETEGLRLIDGVLTEEQWQRFGNEHGSRLRPAAPRYLPWLLDGLDAGRANRILGNVPEPLRLAYREQWQSAYAQFDRWAVQ